MIWKIGLEDSLCPRSFTLGNSTNTLVPVLKACTRSCAALLIVAKHWYHPMCPSGGLKCVTIVEYYTARKTNADVLYETREISKAY